jgi:hypothetical protein
MAGAEIWRIRATGVSISGGEVAGDKMPGGKVVRNEIEGHQ